MHILGLSAFYHDSAACLVSDGEIVAAAQEERFTRKKHDERFPTHAVAYCLEEAGITPDQIDHVAFYDKPLLKFDRIVETWIASAPLGFGMFRMGLKAWARDKLFLTRAMDRGLKGAYRGRYVFPAHHESHAASAFYPSPYEEAAIITLDGVGEWATGSIGVGRGNKVQILKELHFPHSLGLLYSAFTYFCGFRVNSGEYKLMGLAPYGEPRYADLILRELLDLKADGSFRLDLSYFAYHRKAVMTSKRFDALFGGPPRRAETALTQREMDLAASVQKVTEEVMLRTARHAHEVTGAKHLVMAGGVALNCVGNGRLLREGPFDEMWIQPAAGDAGGALGAALLVWHQLLQRPRTPERPDSQRASLLGPRFDSDHAATFLDSVGAVYERMPGEAAVCDRVAELLATENVVGHMQGRMEFGPRALGGRSILGDPRSPAMQRTMNLKIKFRESFRPFAPSVLLEHAHEVFELEKGQESPYMLLVAPVREDRRLPPPEGAAPTGLDRLSYPRSDVPAITHVDDSARVQTVDEQRNPRYAGILRAFHKRTGCPLVINTSFNVRGEPIVCTPKDAYDCFMATDMDVLVIEDLLLLKSEQPADQVAGRRETHLAQFALD
ncbi:MAG: carbamoyltransferase family protein [Planctomycetota bacterium]|jgi:carbamoyltransferase